MTGQAARLVIGQTTFTAQDTNSSDTILGATSGIAYAADTLFVADSNRAGSQPDNNRVLLFGNLSSQLPAPTAEIPYNRKCPVCVGQATVVLGQPDFVSTTVNAATANSLRQPTAVASDGVHLVVADTNHNRVLIWNHIPTSNNAPADVVVGQPDFVSASIPGNLPNAKAMRGPQGVWIQNGKLFVADTQYNRVLIYNQIPTSNGAAADVVLGAPNFTTFVNPDVSQQSTSATASNLLNPVSVTSDGTHVFVTDLGYNRVLIWNHIPTSSGAPADVVIGQPDMVSSLANNSFTGTAATSSTDNSEKESPVLCTTASGTDPYGNPTYPNSCNATLNYPRFTLAAAGRLFIADGGNDRVLVFKSIPTAYGALADVVLGQVGGDINQASDAADSLRTPSSLAWDGTNLYVSDTYNRRVSVFTIGISTLQYQAVRNSASMDIIADGTIAVGGAIQAGDVVTVTINNVNYTYTVLASDTLKIVTQAIVDAINSSNSGNGDPNVIAALETISGTTTTTYDVLLTARVPGDRGDDITYSATATPPTGTSSNQITVTSAGSSLTGGGDAAKVAPGTIVAVLGTNLAAGSATADTTQNQLPTKLGGTEVYFNGIQAPLLWVSPTQVNAQIPWELGDTTSINAYVRSEMSDGSVMYTNAVAATIVPANPGIFTIPGTSDPVQVVMYHSSSNATAVVSVDGTPGSGDVATVTVNGRAYSYTSSATDTLDSIRDALVAQLNNDPQVTAAAAGVFDRIILTARVQGPEGGGIPITATESGGSLTMTAIDSQTTGASVAGSQVTSSNPAFPGEIVTVYGTGLGMPVLSDAVQPLIQTGLKYPVGAPSTVPQEFVSSTVGGSTADVLQATLTPGMVGVYTVLLHLNAGLATEPNTSIDIAQDVYISNKPAFPLVGASNTTSSAPVLTITSAHSANFTQGQQGATYVLTVSYGSGGGNPTAGKVTVTDTLPTGLTLVSMSGDGWTCSASVCSRTDPLTLGSSYPTITVTVNVDNSAASTVVNSVKVQGGTSAIDTATDSTVVNAK